MGENEYGDTEIQLVQQQQVPYSRLEGKWGSGLGMGDETSPGRTRDFCGIFHLGELQLGNELCSVN